MSIVKKSFFLFLLLPLLSIAQETETDELPYHQIPNAPEQYTEQAILARMIDGLGYRYYWATKDLRDEDLNFNPGNEGRPAKDVLKHLYGLSEMILNTIKAEPNVRPLPELEMTWEEQRAKTLLFLKEASDILRSAEHPEPEDMKIIFQRGEKQSEFPFWNLLNGPLADAIWHTGQIASFRRSSGNPVDPGMNVFMGKTRE